MLSLSFFFFFKHISSWILVSFTSGTVFTLYSEDYQRVCIIIDIINFYLEEYYHTTSNYYLLHLLLRDFGILLIRFWQVPININNPSMNSFQQPVPVKWSKRFMWNSLLKWLWASKLLLRSFFMKLQNLNFDINTLIFNYHHTQHSLTNITSKIRKQQYLFFQTTPSVNLNRSPPVPYRLLLSSTVTQTLERVVILFLSSTSEVVVGLSKFGPL